jgi:hypothetical protein
VDDQELRAMIRASIAHHLGSAAAEAPAAPAVRSHASHAMLPLVRGGDEGEGVCLIEPAVHCNHCGYCLSFGH